MSICHHCNREREEVYVISKWFDKPICRECCQNKRNKKKRREGLVLEGKRKKDSIYFQQWYKQNKEKHCQYMKEYLKKNKEKQYARTHTFSHRKKILDYFNHSCQTCRSKENVEIHHISYFLPPKQDPLKQIIPNLVLLCRYCKSKKKDVKENLDRNIMKKIRARYQYHYDATFQRLGAKCQSCGYPKELKIYTINDDYHTDFGERFKKLLPFIKVECRECHRLHHRIDKES